MDRLPDELLLHIISFLDSAPLCNLSLASTHFLRLARDSHLWKHLCFAHSATEQRRRRLASSPPSTLDPLLADLIRTTNLLESGLDVGVTNNDMPSADTQHGVSRGMREKALLANWDPSYSAEPVDWYKEFVDRHAEVKLRWFEHVGSPNAGEDVRGEATGVGILFGADGHADRLVAPMDDGSVRIWDARAQSDNQGRCIARSELGLLSAKGADLDRHTRMEQSRSIMTDTGAVECVSIDSTLQRGYFAVQNTLNEVDLHTLHVVARTPFPFPITALSAAHHSIPLTIGTNWTLHLHDPRKPPVVLSPSHCELISGSGTDTSFARHLGTASGHVSLAQPGALSILHLPPEWARDANGDIWVAGRFTSMLNFDRRFFPRLRGTVHSGARLSCLTALPFPFIPQQLRLGRPYTFPTLLREARERRGYTILATGEYKGKGSVELYALSDDPAHGFNSSDARTMAGHAQKTAVCYQNRQTASRSKVLSATTHGTRIVFADADGVVKWVERDASTPVREVNVNHFDASGELAPLAQRELQRADTHTQSGNGERMLVNPHVRTQANGEDIVQKILSTTTNTTTASSIGQDNLVLWTSDGKLGALAFGMPPFEQDVWMDALERLDDADGGAVAAAAAAAAEEETKKKQRDKETIYSGEMRRALEMQARELRWLRGYGLGG